jgi:hypothetical protein
MVKKVIKQKQQQKQHINNIIKIVNHIKERKRRKRAKKKMNGSSGGSSSFQQPGLGIINHYTPMYLNPYNPQSQPIAQPEPLQHIQPFKQDILIKSQEPIQQIPQYIKPEEWSHINKTETTPLHRKISVSQDSIDMINRSRKKKGSTTNTIRRIRLY